MTTLPAQAHGVLLLNKPSGLTSAACLERIKRGLGQKKIGHAGTLDPMARGLLVVLLGQATKLAPYVSEGFKEYTGALRLGQATDTYDSEGSIVEEKAWGGITPAAVEEEILSWTGLREQEVPPYSAAKHKGRPLYALSRAGLEVPRKFKPVRIDSARMTAIDLPHVFFNVICSPGTYVRSLAHSLGQRVGTGAVLTELTRVASRPYRLENAVDLDDLLAHPERFTSYVLSPADALFHWEQVRLNARQSMLVRNGGRVECTEAEAHGTQPLPGRRALLLSETDVPLALAEVMLDGTTPRWTILRGIWSANTET